MEAVLLDIFLALRTQGVLNGRQLDQIIRRHNKLQANAQLSSQASGPSQASQTGISHQNSMPGTPSTPKTARYRFAKKELLPFYLHIRDTDHERWSSWNLDEELEEKLLNLLRVKPRRTASGVATITVITKPWSCSGICLYCPNDLRMPKSYLSGEPACQRAERNYFDPYLQVSSRLKALRDMGHITHKVELIVLGGTWSDYPLPYQLWFIKELFRALNEGSAQQQNNDARHALYRRCGLSNEEDELERRVEPLQQAVNRGELGFNDAIVQLYEQDPAWICASSMQQATMQELEAQQKANETAEHRMVGLVVETRPDTITAATLTLLRRMGCTKIQMGVQSLDPAVLRLNDRSIGVEQIQSAFELARIFGFKILGHFMVNLYGATAESDREDYLRFVTEAAYQPDELKLYPCSLVEGARLCSQYAHGSWKPYTEAELLDVLTADLLVTPSFVRISRMIRDISAADILVGNKKTNLRQMVEHNAEAAEVTIQEIRHREIATSVPALEDLRLINRSYETTVSTEHFLEWATPDNRIAGFLRLSLPNVAYVEQHQANLPIRPHEAMIREVHIYGKVARLHAAGEDAQHLGLGRQLIEAACTIAHSEGYDAVNVISSVGTRLYYRSLGFEDGGLYQKLRLSTQAMPE
ncbi:MAG: tRNA uridine(34) 5-carboxymethylaminomethyl modification radical SAM/GNAT enzyme Elp3 [Coriobacteriales bacterium]|jgi:elongator complex protein 3|nr:tRNA uridine(34) 5-carboxymethylaminomethyl modification radical SAM/GNAT enzyme Elp3 [Coriobacteriales bacterium]